MRVHFVNLDRSPDRLAEFRQTNGHLSDPVRFPAIDGQRLDITKLSGRGLVSPDILEAYRPGAVGVAMSNLALWDMAIETGLPQLTICQDDAILHPGFETHAQQVIKTLPSDWDFILWGWNFDSIFSFEMLPGVSNCFALFEEARMTQSVKAFRQQALAPRAFRLQMAWGIPCYTVSAKGARALKSRLLPFRPMVIPRPTRFRQPGMPDRFLIRGLDGAFNTVYADIAAFVCFPPLVIVRNEHAKSTIQAAGVEAAPAEATATSPPPATADVGATLRSAAELQKRGQFDQALALYEKVLAASPDDVAALAGRAGILMDLERFEAALAAYDRLLALRPADVNILNLRGLALESLKRPEEALASYDKALAVAPSAVEAHYNRGNILADLARFEEALASYDKALALKPDVASILNNRGLVLEELKRYDEALANYEKALKLKPDYAAAADNRRLLVQQRGVKAAR